MNMLDVDAIRAQVRALDFTRGTPADAAMRREDDADARANLAIEGMALDAGEHALRSEEHTSELQSLMRISYAVFCLKKKKQPQTRRTRYDKTMNINQHIRISHTPNNTITD